MQADKEREEMRTREHADKTPLLIGCKAAGFSLSLVPGERDLAFNSI